MFGDLFAAARWLGENWWIVAIGAGALVTMQFWLTPLVRFLTETKVGAALSAAVLAFGGGYLLLKKDREAQYQRGRADAEREMRVRSTPKTQKTPSRNEWWLQKKARR